MAVEREFVRALPERPLRDWVDVERDRLELDRDRVELDPDRFFRVGLVLELVFFVDERFVCWAIDGNPFPQRVVGDCIPATQ